MSHDGRVSGTSRPRRSATRVGLSPATILRYYREGRIPGRRLPGRCGRCGSCGARSRRSWDCERQLSLGRCGVMREAPQDESIRALATVTLDAGALDELGPRTIDRLADLVAERLAERRALGEAPLLTAQRGRPRWRACIRRRCGARSAPARCRSPATSGSDRGCGARTSTPGSQAARPPRASVGRRAGRRASARGALGGAAAACAGRRAARWLEGGGGS